MPSASAASQSSSAVLPIPAGPQISRLAPRPARTRFQEPAELGALARAPVQHASDHTAILGFPQRRERCRPVRSRRVPIPDLGAIP